MLHVYTELDVDDFVDYGTAGLSVSGDAADVEIVARVFHAVTGGAFFTVYDDPDRTHHMTELYIEQDTPIIRELVSMLTTDEGWYGSAFDASLVDVC